MEAYARHKSIRHNFRKARGIYELCKWVVLNGLCVRCLENSYYRLLMIFDGRIFGEIFQGVKNHRPHSKTAFQAWRTLELSAELSFTRDLFA